MGIQNDRSRKKVFDIKKGIFLFLLLSVGLSLSYFFGRASAKEHITLVQLREPVSESEQYKFISPLLGCLIGGVDGEDSGSFTLLKNKLSDIVNEKKQKGDIATASIYFDTRNGQWLGINTEEQYAPASLLKVVDLIAVLRERQNDATLWEKKFLYTSEHDANEGSFFQPTKSLQSGSSYSVQEMVESMILYSDNAPLETLENIVGTKKMAEVYNDFHIHILSSGTNQASLDFMTVKSYANFFRVLYNSTYLRRTNSEYALELLSRAQFNQGIRAGIPSHIVFAGKFGERDLAYKENAQDGKELHDCGIVYLPQKPYLLCIMTKGKDFQKQSETLKDISKLIYEFMEKQYPQQ